MINNKKLIPIFYRNLIKIFDFDDINEIKKFFQSIITNDINKINNEVNSIYTLLLNSSGKILFDIFLIIKEDESLIYIDCDQSISLKLIQYIKKYKMRLEFEIEIMQNINIFSDIESENGYKISENILFSYDDNIYGHKRYIVQNIEINKNYIDDFYHIYHKKRMLNFVFDCVVDLIPEKSFPINFNFYDKGFISLKKGCYIGQEQSNRLYRTANIKNKIYLCELLARSRCSIEKNAKIFYLEDDKYNEIGLIISNLGDMIFIFLNKDYNKDLNNLYLYYEGDYFELNLKLNSEESS